MASDARIRDGSPLRQRFGRLLTLVGEAMRDIEWVDSYDKGRGDEDQAILSALAGPGQIGTTLELPWNGAASDPESVLFWDQVGVARITGVGDRRKVTVNTWDNEPLLVRFPVQFEEGRRLAEEMLCAVAGR